jgi:hypothetical protein
VNLSGLVKLVLTNGVAGITSLNHHQPPLHREITPENLRSTLVTKDDLANRSWWRDQSTMISGAKSINYVQITRFYSPPQDRGG